MWWGRDVFLPRAGNQTLVTHSQSCTDWAILAYLKICQIYFWFVSVKFKTYLCETKIEHKIYFFQECLIRQTSDLIQNVNLISITTAMWNVHIQSIFNLYQRNWNTFSKIGIQCTFTSYYNFFLIHKNRVFTVYSICKIFPEASEKVRELFLTEWPLLRGDFASLKNLGTLKLSPHNGMLKCFPSKHSSFVVPWNNKVRQIFNGT
jgi:hypothetical protein